MDITQTLNSFRRFLNVAWDGLPEWIKDYKVNEDIIEDWYQANWEIIVESEIHQRIDSEKLDIGFVALEVFGYGADCNGASSRILSPDILPTHYVQVNGDYRFDSFGHISENGWFEIEFPFEFCKVLDKNENEIILPAKDLKFNLIKIIN